MDVDASLVGVAYVVTPCTAVHGPASLNMSAASGTRLTFTWTDGYITLGQWYAANVSLINPQFHIFTIPNRYNTSVTVNNSLSTTLLSDILITVSYPITYLTLTANACNVSENCDFSRSVDGTHVICVMTFDSNNSSSVNQTSEDTPESTLTYTYVYGSAGIYYYNLTCYNCLGLMKVTGSVAIQIPITDLLTTSTLVRPYGGDIYITWTMLEGTNVTFTATLNDVSIPGVTFYGNGSGVAILLVTFYEVGDHTVQITGINLVSRADAYVSLTIDKNIMELGLNSSVLHVATNGIVTFHASVTEGSRMNYTFMYGDGSQDSVFSASTGGADSVMRSYIYIDAGFYSVSVIVVNTVSNLSFAISVNAEDPIANLDMTYNNVSKPSILVTFTITLTSGRAPTNSLIKWIFCDGDPLSWLPFDASSSSLQNHIQTHGYPDYGLYCVNISIYNNVSELTILETVMVGVYIANLTITPDNTCGTIDINVTFTVRIDAGSNVMYILVFDDGLQSDPVSRSYTGNWSDPDETSVSHMYIAVGYFQVYVVANNTFGKVNVSLHSGIQVQHPIPNSQVVQIGPFPFPPGTAEVDIIVTGVATYEAPTDAMCYYDYGDGINTNVGPVTMVFNENNTFSYLLSYSSSQTEPGRKTIRVNCSNCVSPSVTYTLEGFPQEPVTGLRIKLNPTCFKVNESGAIHIELNSGSHYNVYVAFGDDSSNIHTFYNTSSPAPDMLFHNQYTEDINFTLTANVTNDVSMATNTSILIVQYELPVLVLTVNTQNTSGLTIIYDTGPTLFEVQIAQGEQPPTSVFCSWELYTGMPSPEVTYAGELRSGQSHLLEYTYGYALMGKHNVTLNCSNCVSSKQYITEIHVVEVIRGFTLSQSHGHAKVGENVIFNFTVTNGSDVWGTMPYGDGHEDTAKFVTIHANESTLIFQHSYSNPGTYSSVLFVENPVSNSSLAMLIVIEYPVTSLSLAYENVTRPTETIRYDISQASGDPPTNAVMNISDCNFNTTTFVINTSTPYAFEHYCLNYGIYMITIHIYNNVSEWTFTDVLRVGVYIEGFSLVTDLLCASADVQEVVFTVSITAGSTVIYNISFGDGHSMSAPRVDANWTTADIHVFPATFTSPGVYTIIATAMNTFGMETLSLASPLKIEYAILNVSALYLGTVPLPPGDVNITLLIMNPDTPAPTEATCSVDYGDGVASSHPMTFEGLYLKYLHHYDIPPGWVTVDLNCSNCVSMESFNTTFLLEERLTNLILVPSAIHLKAPSNFTLFTSVASGSHFSFLVDFGDGTANATYNCSVVCIMAFVWNHTYEEGIYNVFVIVCNNKGCLEDTLVITVQYEIKDITLICELLVEWPTGSSTLDVRPDAKSHPPTSVYCKFSFYSGFSLRTVYAGTALRNNVTHVEPFIYTFPRIAWDCCHVNVSCYNLVSEDSKTCNVLVEQRISGQMCTFDVTQVKDNQEISIVCTVENGTRVNVSVDYNDTTNATASFPHIHAFLVTVNFLKSYATADNYTLTFFFTNNIGTVNYTSHENITVQHEVVDLNLTVSYPVPFPAEANGLYAWAQPTLEWSSCERLPTSVFVNYTFHEHLNWMHYVGTFCTLNPFLRMPQMIGYHVVEYTWYNLISSMSGNFTVLMQRVIEDIDLQILVPFVQIGANGSFILSVLYGSHLTFSVDFSDGGPTYLYRHPNPLDSRAPFEFNHTYHISGNFSINVTAYNDVSTVTHEQTYVVIVQTPVTNLSVECESLVLWPPGVTTFDIRVPEDVASPDNVHVTWNPGNDNMQYNYMGTSGGNFIIDYTYQEVRLGIVTAIFIASNTVSMNTFTCQSEILRKIEGVAVKTNRSTIPSLTPVIFVVTIEKGSQANVTLYFNQTYSRSVFVPGNVTGQYIQFEHIYYESGNYTLFAIARNSRSKAEGNLSTLFRVLHPILADEVEGLCDTWTEVPPGKVDINLTLSADHRVVPSDVHVAFPVDGVCPTNRSDQSLMYQPDWPIQVSFIIADYTRYCNISVCLSNTVSNIIKTCHCNLQLRPKGLYHNLPKFVIVGRQYDFIFGVTEGSHVKYNINFYRPGRTYYGEAYDENDIENHVIITMTFLEPGRFEVSATASNHFHSVSLSEPTSIIAQYGISDFRIVPLPAKIDQGPASIQIIYSGLKDIGEVNVAFSFGDNTSQLFESILVFPPPLHVIDHMYTTPGQYRIIVNISNPISYRLLNATLEAEFSISDVTLTITDQNHVTLIPGDNGVTKVLIDTSIILKAIHTTGSSVLYSWDIRNTTDSLLTQRERLPSTFNEFIYNITEGGYIYVRLNVSNAVSYRYIVRTLQVSTSLTPTVKEWEKYRVVQKGVMHNMTVSLKDPQIVCLRVRGTLGEVVVTYWGGTHDMCQLDPFYSDSLTTPVLAKDTYLLQHQYLVAGLYKLEIKVFNRRGSASLELKLVVTDGRCLLPKVTAKKGASRYSPVDVKRAIPYTILTNDYFTIIKDCPISNGTTQVLTILPDSPTASNINLTGSGKLTIGRNTLLYGLYQLTATVGMINVSGIETQSYAWILITATAIQTCAGFENASSLRVGFGEQLAADSTKCTVDKDNTVGGFVARWKCRQELEPDANGIVAMPPPGKSSHPALILQRWSRPPDKCDGRVSAVARYR